MRMTMIVLATVLGFTTLAVQRGVLKIELYPKSAQAEEASVTTATAFASAPRLKPPEIGSSVASSYEGMVRRCRVWLGAMEGTYRQAKEGKGDNSARLMSFAFQLDRFNRRGCHANIASDVDGSLGRVFISP